MITQFFAQQMDFIFFFYGLAFILLGAICLTIRNGNSGRLPWFWLGLFGLTHGVNEWLDMFANSWGDGTIFAAFRLGVMMFSYIFLVEFARVGLRKLSNKGPGRWIYIPLLLLVIPGGLAGINGLNIAARYALGLVGGLGSALVFWRVAKTEKNFRRNLIFVALAMSGYAIAAGVIVPKADFFPAVLINSTSFQNLTGIPIQFCRGILAVLITALVWEYYQISYQLTCPEIEGQIKKFYELKTMIMLIVILILGGIYTEFAGKEEEQQVRNEILKQTKIATAALNPGRVMSLTGTVADLGQPDYIRVHEHLLSMYEGDPELQRIYLMLQHDGRVVFVDSISRGKFNYSKIGERFYKQPPPELVEVFTTGQALTVGPFKTGRETCLSGFAVIRDPKTRRIIAVLGIDFNAVGWQSRIARHRLSAIYITLLIAMIFIGFFIIRQRFWESSQLIALSEQSLAEAQEVSHFGNWNYYFPNKQVTWSDEMFNILGRDPQLGAPAYPELQNFIDPKDWPKFDAAVQKSIEDGVGHELELRILRPNGSRRHIFSKVKIKRERSGEITRIFGTVQDITERKQIETRLAEALELTQTMLSASALGIITYRASGECVFANEAAAKIINASVDQLHAQNFRQLKSWQVSGLLAAAEAALATRTTQGSEFHFTTTFGKEIWVESSLTTFTSGDEPHLLVMLNDITRRKHTEEQLLESEFRYRSMFKNSHVIMLLVNPESGAIVDANREACTFYGYNYKDLLKLKINQINTFSEPQIKAEMRNAKKERRNYFTLEHRLANGELRQVEVYSGPIMIGGNEFICSIIHDITEKKRAEAAVLEAQQKYAELVNNLSVGIYRKTPGLEGRYLEVNAAMVEMFEAESKELLMTQKASALYVNPKKCQNMSDKLLAHGFVGDEEHELQTLKGRKFWASISAVSKTGSDGQVYFDGVVADITERKWAEEKLRELSLIDDLTGLYNRRGFLTLASQQLKIAHRLKQGLALFYLDLDRMKLINDTLGHREGDRALIDTASILRNTFRASDIVARIGGDEFIGLSIETSVMNGKTIMDRLLGNLNAHNLQEGREYQLSFSVGVTHYNPENPCSLDELIAHSDRMMYKEKMKKKIQR